MSMQRIITHHYKEIDTLMSGIHNLRLSNKMIDLDGGNGTKQTQQP